MIKKHKKVWCLNFWQQKRRKKIPSWKKGKTNRFPKKILPRSFRRKNCHRTKESKYGFASVVMNDRRQSIYDHNLKERKKFKGKSWKWKKGIVMNWDDWMIDWLITDEVDRFFYPIQTVSPDQQINATNLTLAPMLFKSCTAKGGKYVSQCRGSANLAISSSSMPSCCIICHWNLADPVFATALLYKPNTEALFIWNHADKIAIFSWMKQWRGIASPHFNALTNLFPLGLINNDIAVATFLFSRRGDIFLITPGLGKHRRITIHFHFSQQLIRTSL